MKSWGLKVLCLFAVLVSIALRVPVSHAATMTVTNTNDGGQGSLREAVAVSMSTAAADTINFGVSGTITLNSALPDIVSTGGTLTIDGAGQNIAISCNNSARVCMVDDGAVLALKNFTIRDCAGMGALYNRGTLTLSNMFLSGNSAGNGGAVFSPSGTLNVLNSTFLNNSTWGSGGAILSTGSLNVSGSTFEGNTAGLTGGGISSGSLDNWITNSTFSGNSATTGGGIYHDYGPLNMVYCTLSGNTATAAGGGIGVAVAEAWHVALVNTIVANNSGGNCSSPIGNLGNNIDSGSTCGWGSAEGSMSNMDPLLGPLGDNGGPAYTMSLLPGSPAIDGATKIIIFTDPSREPRTDQRGIARPNGVRNDIGAYELASLEILPSFVGSGTVSCSPNPVPAFGDSACSITPTNNSTTGDFNYISKVLIADMSFPIWFPVQPTTRYIFNDITTHYYIEATFAPTTIWLYRYALFANPPWEWQSTGFNFADALLDAGVYYPLTDTIRVPTGAFKEAGGVTCFWNVHAALSGGWTSQTVRDSTNPMSTIAGPVTIGSLFSSSCTLTMDGITVE